MSKRHIPSITFAIDFYNMQGQRIASSTLEASDYWEACLHGHALLFGGSIPHAEEFELTEQRMAA